MMGYFDVSVITDVDSYFTSLANNSCCGASSTVKMMAKGISILDTGEKVKYLEQMAVAPSGQLSQAWKDKAQELLG